MTFRIDNIKYLLHSNHDFEFEADFNYTNQPQYHVQYKIAGYIYDYYMDLATKLKPQNYAANQNADGTTKATTDPTFSTTPTEEDVARIYLDFIYPNYMNPPAAATNPVSGTAPGLV